MNKRLTLFLMFLLFLPICANALDYIGDLSEDQTVYWQWSTNAAAGESITRATNGTISVWRNNTTSSTAGVSDIGDADQVGVHHLTITTTDAFYTASADYTATIAAMTVDGKVVNYPIVHWSVQNRSAVLASSAPTNWGSLAITTTGTVRANVIEVNSAPISVGVTPPTAIEVRQEMDANSDIVADTNELVGDDIPTLIAAAEAKIDTVDGIVDDILVDTGTTLNTLVLDIPTVSEFGLRSLLAAEYGTAAAQASLNTLVLDIPTVSEFGLRSLLAAEFATAAAQASLNTLVLDIPTVSEFGLRSLLAAEYATAAAQTTAQSDLNIATGTDGVNFDSTAVASLIDDNWDEILTGLTHNIQNSAGKRLRDITADITHSGTCQAGSTTNTIVLDTGASATSGSYDPSIIVIVEGTGAGQARMILEYAGATRIAYVGRDWKVLPDGTSEFLIFADAGWDSVNEGRAQGDGANGIILNALAKPIDDIYNGQTIFLRSGTGQDQVRLIQDYDGATKVATVSSPWEVQPDATTNYVIRGTFTYTDAELATLVQAMPIDGSLDLETALKNMNAVLNGKTAAAGGATTTVTYYNAAGDTEVSTHTITSTARTVE